MKQKKKFLYEPISIKYIEPPKLKGYKPDIFFVSKSGKLIIVETKGEWNAADRTKHLFIKQQYPDLDIRFVFERSSNRISKRSNTTYADICNGLGRGPFKGVQWQFADGTIPREWLNE